MRIVSACFLFFLLFFFTPFYAVANSGNKDLRVSGGEIDKAQVETVPIRFLPNHPLYFLITFKENVSRFFKPSAAKRAEFDFVLSGKRLKETYVLLKNNRVDKAIYNLGRYNTRLEEMTKQIEKARSQNQDIANLVSVISDGFQFHETFLISFLDYEIQLGSSLETATDGFEEAVKAIDKLDPGVKDRFKILKSSSMQDEDNDSTESSSVEGESIQIFEATASVRPRRIIF